ncbi:MAG: M42 family peptidase [Anaerolineae bacterium]|nr:M42 family peptidase [Anaerolineae bacterium]
MIDVGLLEKLSNAVAVAGAESEVRKLIRDQIKDKVVDLTVDALGNLIVRRAAGSESNLKIMLTAPMDEIGFMVSDVGDNGLISVHSVGRHDLRYLPAARVVVGSAKTPGVIMSPPIHRWHDQNTKAVDDFQIDTGATGKGGIKVGDRAAFMGMFAALTDTVVRGKAFESRAACAILIALLDGDPFPYDVYVVFSTQKKVGTRGAQVAANRIDPDLLISVSGVEADDIPRSPDEDDRGQIVRLGGGPVLNLKDWVYVTDRPMLDYLVATADANNIPYQFSTQDAFTEAGMIATLRDKTVTVDVSLPVRYLQSPLSLLNLTDVENTAQLLRTAIMSLTPNTLLKKVTS